MSRCFLKSGNVFECLDSLKNLQPQSKEEIATLLEEYGNWEEAGPIFEEIGLKEEAVGCYIKAKDYGKVSRLIKDVKNRKLINQYGAYLQKIGHFQESISQYKISKNYKAIV